MSMMSLFFPKFVFLYFTPRPYIILFSKSCTLKTIFKNVHCQFPISSLKWCCVNLVQPVVAVEAAQTKDWHTDGTSRWVGRLFSFYLKKGHLGFFWGGGYIFYLLKR